MAIVKLFLLLIVAITKSHVITPPNARPPTEQLRELHGSEYAIPYAIVFGKIVNWTWTLFEGSVLFALSGYCPPVLAQPILRFLLPTSVNQATLTALSPSFLAGAVLGLSGTLLRGYCFHVLGSRFTFELAIRPSHALVTDGVYGIVRHPSYTGAFIFSVGSFFWMLDRESVCAGLVWAVIQGKNSSGSVSGSEDGIGLGVIMTTLLACSWVTMLGLVCMIMAQRMDKEDAMLEKNFGDEWRAWAKKVPYRLAPGIY